MENGEVMMKGPDEVDESGYSEKKLDKNVDLQAGQWLDLHQDGKKSPPQQKAAKKSQSKKQDDANKAVNTQSSTQQIKKRDQKLVQAIDGINAELQSKIDEYLKMLVEDMDKAEEVLRSIIDLQGTQKSLLQALKWEAKGDLNISKLPKQVQNLLK